LKEILSYNRVSKLTGVIQLRDVR